MINRANRCQTTTARRGSAPFRDAQPDDPVGVAPEDLLAHIGGDVSLVPPGAEPLDMLKIELGVRVIEPEQQPVLKFIQELEGEGRVAGQGIESGARRQVAAQVGIGPEQPDQGSAGRDWRLGIAFLPVGRQVAADLAPEGSAVAEEAQVRKPLEGLLEPWKTQFVDQSVRNDLRRRGMKGHGQAQVLARRKEIPEPGIVPVHPAGQLTHTLRTAGHVLIQHVAERLHAVQVVTAHVEIAEGDEPPGVEPADVENLAHALGFPDHLGGRERQDDRLVDPLLVHAPDLLFGRHHGQAVVAFLQHRPAVDVGVNVDNHGELFSYATVFSRTDGSFFRRWLTGSTSIPADNSAVAPSCGSVPGSPKSTVSPTCSPITSSVATVTSTEISLPSSSV